jgi:hypothetical protein
MPALTSRHVVLVVSATLVLLLLVGIGCWQIAVSEIKARVLEILGPLATVERIDVGVSNVTLTGVLMRASHDWPVSTTFRAQRIVIVIDKRALASRHVEFSRVTVDDYYLAIERTQDGGLRLLPNFKLEVRESDGQSIVAAQRANEHKLIDQVELRNGSIDFVDRSVQKPAYHIVIADAHAHLEHIDFPGLTGATSFNMSGTLAGPSHIGQVSSRGWIEIANSDSQIRTTLHNVDISKLDPYLFQKAGAIAEFRSGTIDAVLDSTVKNLHLHASGKFTLINLELAHSREGNPIETLSSIPKNAAVAALKDNRGRINQTFTLDGNLKDPKFSLTENLQAQFAAGFAKALGSGARGVAKGAGEAIKGVGQALLNVLPN